MHWPWGEKVKGHILTLTLGNLHSPGVGLHVDTTAHFSGSLCFYFAVLGVPLIAMSVSVCLFVFLSVALYLKNHLQISRNFLHMSTVAAVTRSSYDDSGIRYILRGLCMTSCFHIMEPMSPNQRLRDVSSSSLGGSTGSEVAVYDSKLVVHEIVAENALQRRSVFNTRGWRYFHDFIESCVYTYICRFGWSYTL